MPLYRYVCDTCSATQDAFRRISERADGPACQKCGGTTSQRITGTAIRVFTPYVTPCFDKEEGRRMPIRNRAEHEAFLRRNGLEEVGNDKRCSPLALEEHLRRQSEMKKELESQPASEFSFDEATHGAAL